MGNRLKLAVTCLATAGVLLTGCYRAEHFDMPGTAEEVDHSNDYTVPDPFDGSNAVWLIKDGVPDFTKMSVLGFTDFAVSMSAEPEDLSWRQGTDRNGKVYYGCRQHKIDGADNADNFGGNQLSYLYNGLFSRLYVENGVGKRWKMKARMALEQLGVSTFSRFIFEGAEWAKQANFGFDWTSAPYTYLYLYRAGSEITGLNSSIVDFQDHYVVPCEPFDIEISCVDRFIWVRIGGKVLWGFMTEDMPEHVFPLMFYPWKGAVRFYDLSIEGDYVISEPVAVQRERGYVNIQAPALASVGGTTLLFAEGRHEVTAQTASLASVRSNATDIMLKRSSDNGQTWGEWSVLKGGDGGVYLRPEVVNAGDKLYLFYTVDINGKQDGDYRIEYLESADGGASWSQGEGTVEAKADGYVVSTLSGHGIRMGDGKLVLPLQCRFGSRGTVAALYSDDNGAHWNMGAMVSGLRNNGASLIETEGKLVMYISHSSDAKSRYVVVSVDGGATWSEPVVATIPIEHYGFQVGGATVAGTDGTIYHFTPEGAEKTSSFSGGSLDNHPSLATKMIPLYLYRPEIQLFGKGLTMAVSHDGGTEWSSKELTGIHSYEKYLFPTGAMDAVISGNTVILVTEGGVAAPYEGLLIYREAIDE